MKKSIILSIAALFLVGAISTAYFLSNKLVRDESTQEPIHETQSIVFATHKIPLAAPYIIAKEKGFFEKYGLDVEMVYFTTGLETLHALTTKKAQFASTGVTPFVHFSFQRNDVKIINQVTLANDFQIIARKDLGVNKLEDLKDKKIGYVKGTITQIAIVDTLKAVGLDQDDYNLVEFNQPLALPNVLRNKELDAFCAWEPFIINTAGVIGEDNTIIFGGEKGLHSLPYLTMTLDSFIENEQNKEIIISFQNALIDSVHYLKCHLNESVDIVSQVTGPDKFKLEKNWNKYEFDVILPKNLLDELELEKKWFDQEGNYQINYADLVESKYLKQINPDGVEF